MKLLAAALLLAFATIGAAISAQFTYSNARFGTSISFPSDIFSEALTPPDNGDGMTWRAGDGATLAVYASYNVLEQSIAEIAEGVEASPGFLVTYSRVNDNWAVISGVDGDNIFYQRIELGAEDVIHSMLLRYPQSERKRYDKLAGPIADTLNGP